MTGGCTQCVVVLLHSLSLSSGVRVTVGVTDTTCALNQEARDPRISKWMRPSPGAHMPRSSLARLALTVIVRPAYENRHEGVHSAILVEKRK